MDAGVPGTRAAPGGPPALVDADIVVRLLTRDVPAQADAADHLLRALDRAGHRIVVPLPTLAEAVFTLLGRYAMSRGTVLTRLRTFIDAYQIHLDEPELLEDLLALWGWRGLSFVDAYLGARARRSGSAIVTFDAALAGVPGIVALRPR